MLILLFTIGFSQSYSGCNQIDPNTGQSICYQNWKQSPDSKSALKCCLSTARDNFNLFDVPIFLLSSYTPSDIKCHYSPSAESCSPQLKCVPENLKDVLGFFNFLDMYQNIPFKDFSKNKTSNWNCFQSRDGRMWDRFLPKHFSYKRIQLLQTLENRLNQNFCRSILLEYVMYGSRYIRRDLCEDSFIFPFRLPRRKNRFRIFNSLERNMAKICMVNDSNQELCTGDSKLFMELQYKNPITVFSDFSSAWRDMGVLDRNNFNWFCGCF